MKMIRYYHNTNTGECNVWFGVPFFFDGPLFKLPNMRDGKQVHVVGLTPYTVELEIPIRADKARDAAILTNNASYIPNIIDVLKAL